MHLRSPPRRPGVNTVWQASQDAGRTSHDRRSSHLLTASPTRGEAIGIVGGTSMIGLGISLAVTGRE